MYNVHLVTTVISVGSSITTAKVFGTPVHDEVFFPSELRATVPNEQHQSEQYTYHNDITRSTTIKFF